MHTVQLSGVTCAMLQTELLLLAQLTREAAQVPSGLKADFDHVLRLTPCLLEELMKVMEGFFERCQLSMCTGIVF